MASVREPYRASTMTARESVVGPMILVETRRTAFSIGRWPTARKAHPCRDSGGLRVPHCRQPLDHHGPDRPVRTDPPPPRPGVWTLYHLPES